MSLVGVRAEIALAVGAVADVTAFSDTFPDSPQPGDALVSWAGLEAQGAPGLFGTTWTVRLVGGGTAGDSLAFVDAHLDDILESLEGLLYVAEVRPVQFETPAAGDAYGVIITGSRE